jgi:hypothetical protein
MDTQRRSTDMKYHLWSCGGREWLVHDDKKAGLAIMLAPVCPVFEHQTTVIVVRQRLLAWGAHSLVRVRIHGRRQVPSISVSFCAGAGPSFSRSLSAPCALSPPW